MGRYGLNRMAVYRYMKFLVELRKLVVSRIFCIFKNSSNFDIFSTLNIFTVFHIFNCSSILGLELLQHFENLVALRTDFSVLFSMMTLPIPIDFIAVSQISQNNI